MAAAWLLAPRGSRHAGRLRRPNSDIQMSFDIYLRARQINDGQAIVDHRTQQRVAPCSSLSGYGVMRARSWHWLDYDSISLVVLLIGIGAVALLVLSI